VDPAEKIAARYEVLQRLGKGAMGTVFRVRDGATGRELALKQLAIGGIRPGRKASAQLRFRREFHTMAGLAHPRIVQVFDYGVAADAPHYTMELLDGRDLSDMGELPVADACRILRDVASALAFLHARRLIHRDVAPRNVRCTSDGRAKLIDFGVLCTPGIVADVAGTPPSIAPESLRGKPLDHRTDLYGLGALAYWTLTGRHAYGARSLAELEPSWKVKPPPPSSIRKEVPEALDALVMSLLHHDPLARPATAAEVIDRLGGIAGLPPAPEAEAARGWLVSAALVGRQKELNKIRKWIDRTTEGEGGALLIEAPSGTGKSRLLREAAVEAQIAGCTVIRAGSDAAGRGPYGILRELSRELLAIAPDTALEAARRHPGVGRVLPELQMQLGGRSDHTAPGDPAEDRMRLQADLSAFLIDVSRRRPLVILVDDVQRSDEASAAVLASVAHGARAAPALVIVGLRTDEQGRVGPALASMRDAGVSLRLRGLDARETEELARTLFGDAPNVGRLARWLHKASVGSPLRATELARQLVDRGTVRYVEGMWIVPEDLREGDVPRDLGEAMDVRITSLGAGARALAEALAVVGGELPLEIVIRLADTPDEEQVFRAIDELVQQEVLIGAGDEWQFRHDGLREALLRNVDPARRRLLHTRAGEALADLQTSAAGKTPRAGSSLPEREAEMGWHFLRGGDTQRGADLLERAGRRLYDAQSFSDAVPLLEAALGVYEREGRADARLRLELRQMLTRAGVLCDREVVLRYADDTIATLGRLAGMDLAGRLRRMLGRLLALGVGIGVAWLRWIFTWPGRRPPTPSQAMSGFVALVSYTASVYSLSYDLPALRRMVALLEPLSALRGRIPAGAYVLVRNFYYMPLGRYREVMQNTRVAVKILETDHLTPLADIDRRMAIGAARFMDAAVAAIQTMPGNAEELAQLEKLGLRFFEASLKMSRVFFHRLRGEESRATELERDAEVLFVQLGSVWVFESQLRWINAISYAFSRDVVGLKRMIPELERFVRAGYHMQKFVEVTRAEYLRERGDYPGAKLAIEKALALIVPEDTLMKQFALAAAVEVHLAAGELERARERAIEGLALAEDPDVGLVPTKFRLVRALALVEAALGDLDGGAKRLDEVLPAATEHANPVVVGSIHEARARIALRIGDRALFEHHRLACDDWFRRTDNPALVARSERLLELGEASRSSAPTAPPLSDDAVTVVHGSDPRARVTRLLTGCRGKHERALRALEALLEETGGASGWLWLAHGGVNSPTLELVAPGGTEPPDTLSSGLHQILEASWLGAEMTIPDVEIGEATVQWHPVTLEVRADGRPLVVAIAAIVEGGLPWHPPDPRFLEAMARALQEAGDVTSERAASSAD
jgi:hypothetical protein